MALIGNRWSAALLGAAFMGASRFGEFEQRMGAPPTIVAERLRTFCEIGVLEQSPNPRRPDWAVYHLTDKGRGVLPGHGRRCWSGASAGSTPPTARRCGWSTFPAAERSTRA